MGQLRPILAMISVQSPGGLVFGTATGMDGQTLHFELDARMEAGDVVEWRMELPGLEENAMGSLRIVAGRRDLGPMPTWVGTIQSVAADDVEIFEVWRRGVEHGTRAFSHSTRAPTDSWLAATTMVGSSEAERKQAVAAQEERRRRRLERAKTLAKNAKAWPDPEDLDGGRSVASGAFRASLSRSVSRSVSVAAMGSTGAPAVEERSRSAVAAALRQGLGPALAPSAPDAGEPVVHVDRGMASVQFLPGAAWKQVYKPALLAGTLRLRRTDVGLAAASVSFFMVLPTGSTVMATGRIRTVAADHSEIDLTLDAAARKMVELA